jgi:hypothetical protein
MKDIASARMPLKVAPPDGVSDSSIGVPLRKSRTLYSTARDLIDRGDLRAGLEVAGLCLDEADLSMRQVLDMQAAAARETTMLEVASRQVKDEQERLAQVHALIADERARLRNERVALEDERRDLQQLREHILTEQAALAERNQPAKRGRQTRRHPPGRAMPDLDADLKPDPAEASNPAEFMECLRNYWDWAGNLSFRDIAAGAGQQISHTTIRQILKGDTLPDRLRIIDVIVQGCGGSDEDRRMFATAWRRLRRKRMQSPLAGVVSLRPAPGAGTGRRPESA